MFRSDPIPNTLSPPPRPPPPLKQPLPSSHQAPFPTQHKLTPPPPFRKSNLVGLRLPHPQRHDRLPGRRMVHLRAESRRRGGRIPADGCEGGCVTLFRYVLRGVGRWLSWGKGGGSSEGGRWAMMRMPMRWGVGRSLLWGGGGGGGLFGV